MNSAQAPRTLFQSPASIGMLCGVFSGLFEVIPTLKQLSLFSLEVYGWVFLSHAVCFSVPYFVTRDWRKLVLAVFLAVFTAYPFFIPYLMCESPFGLKLYYDYLLGSYHHVLNVFTLVFLGWIFAYLYEVPDRKGRCIQYAFYCLPLMLLSGLSHYFRDSITDKHAQLTMTLMLSMALNMAFGGIFHGLMERELKLRPVPQTQEDPERNNLWKCLAIAGSVYLLLQALSFIDREYFLGLKVPAEWALLLAPLMLANYRRPLAVVISAVLAFALVYMTILPMWTYLFLFTPLEMIFVMSVIFLACGTACGAYFGWVFRASREWRCMAIGAASFLPILAVFLINQYVIDVPSGGLGRAPFYSEFISFFSSMVWLACTVLTLWKIHTLSRKPQAQPVAAPKEGAEPCLATSNQPA